MHTPSVYWELTVRTAGDQTACPQLLDAVTHALLRGTRFATTVVQARALRSVDLELIVRTARQDS